MQLVRDNFVRDSVRASQRSQKISKMVADASEGPNTTNTFNINTQVGQSIDCTLLSMARVCQPCYMSPIVMLATDVGNNTE